MHVCIYACTIVHVYIYGYNPFEGLCLETGVGSRGKGNDEFMIRFAAPRPHPSSSLCLFTYDRWRRNRASLTQDSAKKNCARLSFRQNKRGGGEGGSRGGGD